MKSEQSQDELCISIIQKGEDLGGERVQDVIDKIMNCNEKELRVIIASLYQHLTRVHLSAQDLANSVDILYRQTETY